MKVVTLASRKGGSGKTTLACSLAVAAAEQGLDVALADVDPQGSAVAWSERRTAVLGPDVVQISAAAVRTAAKAARERYDLLLFDTPGQATALNDPLALADLALLPCRPTIADVETVMKFHSTSAALATSAAFVLAQVPSRGERRARQAELALAPLGPVAPVLVGMRNAYADALALGLGVTEFEPRGKAADEIRRLWDWTARQLEDAP